MAAAGDEGAVAELRFEEEEELLKPEKQQVAKLPEAASATGGKYAALRWLASSAGGRHWMAGCLGWWLFIFTAVRTAAELPAPQFTAHLRLPRPRCHAP